MNEEGVAGPPTETGGPAAIGDTEGHPEGHGAGEASGLAGAGGPDAAGNVADEAGAARVPLLPGFREMALRRMSQDRGRLMRELAVRRQETGLSQTEVAARMGTSQSAVARLESGDVDVRASTLERYAAALGTEITWKVQD
jgi:hypothetical protein